VLVPPSKVIRPANPRSLCLEKHFQEGIAEPQVPPLRCVPVGMTRVGWFVSGSAARDAGQRDAGREHDIAIAQHRLHVGLLSHASRQVLTLSYIVWTRPFRRNNPNGKVPVIACSLSFGGSAKKSPRKQQAGSTNSHDARILQCPTRVETYIAPFPHPPSGRLGIRLVQISFFRLAVVDSTR
jgi:hypothetical protein